MPLFQQKKPLVFPVSPSGTKRIRYPTGCDSFTCGGAPAAATSHVTGAMYLIPYYLPSNVSSIEIAVQNVGVAGSTGGTIEVGIYVASGGLEDAYLTESTSFVCTTSTTGGTVTVFTLTKSYSEGWHIVSGVKTSGSSAHINGYVRQGHIFGKTPSYPASLSIDMFYLSSNTVYITNQTSGLPSKISSALSSGTYTTTGSSPHPIPFLAY